MTPELQEFLSMNLPKVKPGKKAKFRLGLSEAKLGSAIHEATSLPCESNDLVMELLRGVRLHFGHYVKDLKVSAGDVRRLPVLKRLHL